MSARAAGTIVACAWLATLAACGTPWQTGQPLTPTSYRESRAPRERTVGLLRRLVVLQVDQDAPRACGRAWQGHARLVSPDADAVDALEARGGYEALRPDREALAREVGEDDDTPFVGELLSVVAPPEGTVGRPAGPRLQAWLARQRDEARVDGLLVLHVRRSCPNAEGHLREFNAVATLGLSEWLGDPSALVPVVLVDGAVVEAATGRVAWWRKRGMWVQGVEGFLDADGPRSRRDRRGELEKLVDELEPAVPALLVR